MRVAAVTIVVVASLVAFHEQILVLVTVLGASLVFVAALPCRDAVGRNAGLLAGRIWRFVRGSASQTRGPSDSQALGVAVENNGSSSPASPMPDAITMASCSESGESIELAQPSRLSGADKNPVALLDALRRSRVFTSRIHVCDREEVIRALEYLLQKQNQVPATEFAKVMGIPAYRVAGWVSAKLGERLNLDGYLVVRIDPTTNQVVLQPAVLEQVFEVSL